MCFDNNINLSSISALERKGLIMDTQDLSLQDGPGIRTTIFFKGCTLHCLWCSNPEGQNFYSELMFNETLCKKKYNCIQACKYEAIGQRENGFPKFSREKCKSCETKHCVKACNNSALKISGEYFTADEIIKRVLPNKQFYINSGGGITLSGGEPLAQSGFAREVVNKAIENNLTVGLETCGLFNWNAIKDFIEKFEFIYFDIKCPDNETHLKYTSVENKIILENLKNLSKINPDKIIITLPVIPGVNDTPEMITELSTLCHNLKIKKIRLLPYHSFGKGKYNELGREYDFKIQRELNHNDLENLKLSVESSGLMCWIE